MSTSNGRVTCAPTPSVIKTNGGDVDQGMETTWEYPFKNQIHQFSINEVEAEEQQLPNDSLGVTKFNDNFSPEIAALPGYSEDDITAFQFDAKETNFRAETREVDIKPFYVSNGTSSALERYSHLYVNQITLRDCQGKYIEDLSPQIPIELSTPTRSDKTFTEQVRENLNNPTILTPEQQYTLEQFLIRNENSFSEIPGYTDTEVHHINTGKSHPVYRRPYPESPTTQKIIQAEVENMLQLGLIEPSYSPWASPVTLVKKPDGTNRFCIDYRGLNKVTESDQFPMPNMASLVQQLQGACYLSSMDLVMGYYQCGVAPEDMEKTAFTCSAGLFQYRVLPFGLKTAPSTFNRLMSKVLKSVRNTKALCYLDDVLVYSRTFEQHILDLEEVLDLLTNAGLFVKLKKCQFCRRDFKFLGNIIKDGKIHIDPAKIESVKSFKRPTNVKETQRFLGLTGWLRKHVKDYALISRPLANLTGGKNPKKTFKWDQSCEDSFIGLKNYLIQPGTALTLPDYSKTFVIECDASDYGIAGILTQEGPDGKKIVEYASRLLRPAERAYTITEKECMAVTFSIRKFRAYIADRHFKVITDHSALRWLLRTKDLGGRLTRWSLKLQEYDYDVLYRKGSENLLADSLSRATTILPDEESGSDSERMEPPKLKAIVATVEVKINLTNLQLEKIKEEQGKETWIITIINRIKELQAKDPKMDKHRNYYLKNNILYYRKVAGSKNLRVVIPRKLIGDIMEEFHDNPSGGHFGRDKTMAKIRSRIFWHNMEQDIAQFVKTCEICQLTKPPNTILRGEMQINTVSRVLELVGVDIVGPLPRSKRQNKYLLVIVDHYTKWLEAFPIRNSTAKVVAGHLADTFGRFGTPERLISDNGPQFVSEVYRVLCQLWNVKDVRTSFYHPSSNFTERTNQTIKRLLKSYVNDNHEEWDRYLPQFLMAIRSTVNTTTGFTPAQLFLGRQVNLPWDGAIANDMETTTEAYNDFVHQQTLTKEELDRRAQEKMGRLKSQQKKQYDKFARVRTFNVGDCVKIKNFAQSDKARNFSALAKMWKGPYYVTRKTSEVSYRLKDSHDKDAGSWNVENMDSFYLREVEVTDVIIPAPDPLQQEHSHKYATRSKDSPDKSQ